MKVQYSKFDTSYACAELGYGLRRVLPAIKQVVSLVSSDFADDQRTLYVCLGCPCCIDTPGAEDADVVVSPLAGVDPHGLDVKRFGSYPPFRTPGKGGECESEEDFKSKWKSFLVSILAQRHA